MARVVDTKWFIDKNKSLISQVYEDRLADLSLNNPSVMKALAELRLYRLPPYFAVPTPIKGRIQAQSSVCHDLEDPRKSTHLERELTHLKSTIFYTRVRQEPCVKCGTRRATKDGVCYKCSSNSQEEERELSKLYNRLSVPKEFGDLWLSPKTKLMQFDLGCMHCRTRPEMLDSAELWIGDDLGWGDGICGTCLPRFPLGETWAADGTFAHSYRECMRCGSSDMDYAVWGMCDGCYQEWQDQYIDPQKLYAFVERYGALAALLIRSSSDWITYLKDMLSHKYCWNAGRKSFPVDAELVPFKPKLSANRPAKELKDINVDLEALIHGNDSVRTSKG